MVLQKGVENDNSYLGESYFEINGDQELYPASSTESALLSWRGDPSESHADWTIHILTNDLDDVTYHVHRSVLCFGSRMGRYFAKNMLNSSGAKRSGKTPSIKVELDSKDAKYFPIILDFIYGAGSHALHSSSGTVVTAASTGQSTSFPSLLSNPTDDTDAANYAIDEISTENSVSLRFLARKFEVETMMRAVNRFIQRDLNFQTGPIYLHTASTYNDTRLVESARRFCAESFEQLDKKALMRLPVDLFRTLVKSIESLEEDKKELSLFASRVVSRYFEKNPLSLTAALMIELTDPLLMPYLASEAAICFTALIKDLDDIDVKQHWDGLVRLSSRCAESVVTDYGWSDFSVRAAVDEYLAQSRESSEEVSRIDCLLFATSFAAALERAQQDYEQVLVEQERLEQLMEALQQSVNLVDRINEKKDEHMEKQQKAIEDAQRQILELRERIGDYRKMGERQQQKTVMETAPDSPDYHSSGSPLRNLLSPCQVTAGLQMRKAKKMKDMSDYGESRTKSLFGLL